MSLIWLCIYIAFGVFLVGFNIYLYGYAIHKERKVVKQFFPGKKQMLIAFSVIEILGLVVYPLCKFFIEHH